MADQIAGSTTLSKEPRAHWWRGFGDDLEPVYRPEEAASHGGTIAAHWLIGLLVFDLFLINDYLVTGPCFLAYLIGRLGICTPICLTLLFMVRRCGKHMELFASAVPVVAAATLSAVLVWPWAFSVGLSVRQHPPDGLRRHGQPDASAMDRRERGFAVRVLRAGAANV